MKTTLRCAVFLASLLVVVGLGCGAKNPLAPATISGSVSYKGGPVTGGQVIFFPPSGTPYTGGIAVDGTYSITDLPVGEMVVCVETESVNPVTKESKGGDAAKYQKMMSAMSNRKSGASGTSSSGLEPKYMKIPEKYGKKQTSPLTYTVKNGRNVYAIELE